MLPAAIKHAQGLRVKYQTSLPDFTEICNFSADFQEVLNIKFLYLNINEIRPMEAALIRTDMTTVTGALGTTPKRLKTTEVIKLHYVPVPGLINYLTILNENITDR
jgi:hypothetical protein